MSRAWRLRIGGLGVVALGAALLWGMAGLPAFGRFAGEYGRILARSTVPDRGAGNSVVVTAFDYRGFDTLIEEMILFVAALAVALLLRSRRGERERAAVQRAARQREPRTSESLRWIGGALVGPIALLALYVVTHGHLSPGGGFQGGVVLMAALVVVLVSGRYVIVTRLRGERALEVLEAAGAGGFALIGLGGLVASGAYLQNFLGRGVPEMLDSGGVILAANVSVGLEVAGALLVVAAELVDPRFLLRGSRSP